MFIPTLYENLIYTSDTTLLTKKLPGTYFLKKKIIEVNGYEQKIKMGFIMLIKNC